MENSFLKEQLTELLKQELPAEQAQSTMAPEGRERFKSHNIRQFAAVLILIFPYKNSNYLVFIKRPDYEGVHGGQIAFPGGKLEISDPDLMHTAIREAREELGFYDEIEVLGKLTPLFIPVSGFEVHPYVAFIPTKPGWNPNALEVEHVLEIDIKFLLNKKNVVFETWKLHGIEVKVPFYKIEDNFKIWGATAMITAEFLEVFKKLTSS